MFRNRNNNSMLITKKYHLQKSIILINSDFVFIIEDSMYLYQKLYFISILHTILHILPKNIEHSLYFCFQQPCLFSKKCLLWFEGMTYFSICSSIDFRPFRVWFQMSFVLLSHVFKKM